MEEFRKMVIFSIWKIYMRSRNEVAGFVGRIKKNLKSFNSKVLEVHILTDFLSFEYVKKNLKDTGIKVGVQDVFWEDSGAFVGEVSPLMLKDLGCDSVYLGHSNRKIYFGETDENINKKILACLRNNITPLMLIGETKEEMDMGITVDILKRQLEIGLKGINADMLKKIIIIYEPRWAIGQEQSASLYLIRSMHQKTRELLAQLYDDDFVKQVRILYGGSVNLDNIKEIIEIKEVDGAGAARSAIDALDFIRLIQITGNEAVKRFRNY